MTVSRPTRRETLAWVAAAGAWPTAASHAASGTAGYGRDPKLSGGAATWPLQLTRAQRADLAALADLALPPLPSAPAPSTLGIDAFLDEWISAPYPDQRRDRKVIDRVLAAASPPSRSHFATLGPDDRVRVWRSAAAGEGRADFVRFAAIVAGGYFTHDEGMKAIGYVGNVALEAFPPMTPDVEGRLKAALKRLPPPPSG